MARYSQRISELETELDRVKKAGEPVARLISQIVTLEAALAVLIRHKLMAEFSAEVTALQKRAEQARLPEPADGAH